MARITPSALITEIRGKWHGDTFQMWGGAIVARRTSRPRHTQTAARARYKGIVSTIAGCYDRLTDPQKTGWACYADLLPTEMSGFNAFLARNTTALCADHGDLSYFPDAPPVFTVPDSPAPLALVYWQPTDRFCLSWTTPSLATLYVQSFHAPQAGFSNLNSPAWRHTETVRAAQLQLSLNGSGFPTGTVIRFRARTINAYGEPSPWTDTKTAAKT